MLFGITRTDVDALLAGLDGLLVSDRVLSGLFVRS